MSRLIAKWGLQANRGYTAPDGKRYGSKITARNNIFLNSSKYHVEFNTPIIYPDAETYLNIDNNVYYPVQGAMFKIASKTYDLASWQATDRDVHSTVMAPAFANKSGKFEKIEDFTLPDNSELRSKGVDVAGVTKDLFGKSIEGKPEPGVYELPAVETAKTTPDTTTTPTDTTQDTRTEETATEEPPAEEATASVEETPTEPEPGDPLLANYFEGVLRTDYKRSKESHIRENVRLLGYYRG